MVRSPRTTNFLIVIFVTLGSITYGYSASIIATTLGQPSFLTYMGLDTASNAPQLEGAINGLFQTGGMFGALSCSWIADHFGRRKGLFIGGCFAWVGGALQAGSVDVPMFMVARLLTGFGIGVLLTMVPLYQSEIAPPAIRGLLVGTHGVVITFGYVSASWIGFGFYFCNAGGAQWRIPLAIQVLWPLALCGGVMFIPESPRWYIMQDRIDEAYRAFAATRVTESSESETDIRDQFNLMHAQIVHEISIAKSFKELFTHKTLRLRCLIGFATLFAGQATATQVINNYGPLLYKRLGYDTEMQLLIQSGWISVCPLGNVFNALVVDRIGRTRLLMFGFSGTVVALIGECITVSIFQRTQSTHMAAAAVFFLFFHIACYGVSIDATSYIYASEIFPTPERAKGLAVSISGLFVACIIFLSAAPQAFEKIGWKYYLVFVIYTSVMVPVVYFFFPETARKSLEEVQAAFGDSVEGMDLETEKEMEGRMGRAVKGKRHVDHSQGHGHAGEKGSTVVHEETQKV